MTSRGVVSALIALCALPAFSEDLWNQQVGLPPGYASFPDQQFDDGIFDSYDEYGANDVVVGAGGWHVDSISIEMQASNVAEVEANLGFALLNIFPNSGNASTPGPLDNPANGTRVAVSVTPVAGQSTGVYVTASGLNLSLSAGEYWIDLTPNAGFTAIGETFEDYCLNNPAGALHGTAYINPGGGYMFSSGTAWDTVQNENHTSGPEYGAIDIQGSATPEPASIGLLALGVVGVLRRRRR